MEGGCCEIGKRDCTWGYVALLNWYSGMYVGFQIFIMLVFKMGFFFFLVFTLSSQGLLQCLGRTYCLHLQDGSLIQVDAGQKIQVHVLVYKAVCRDQAAL
jgi:hypothetical protein